MMFSTQPAAGSKFGIRIGRSQGRSDQHEAEDGQQQCRYPRRTEHSLLAQRSTPVH